MSSNYSQPIARLAESLCIAALGGIVFNAVGFPAAWLAGAMVFAGTAALIGRQIFVPTLLARAFYVTLGISLGGVVTPQTLYGIMQWPLSIVVVCVAMICVTAGTSYYLRSVHGWDGQTAMFAGIPGGLSQVMVLAAERDVDLRAVAIVQTIRVVILAVCVPAGMGLFGLAGPTRLPASALSIMEAPGELAWLVFASTAVAVAALRFGFPGGLIFGPMVVSAVLHGGNFVHVGLPSWCANSAMVGIGAVSGSRFVNTGVRLLGSYLGAALGSFAVSIVIAGLFALAATAMMSIHISDLIVAYAPGSVDAMMILALALHADPVFVGAHHLARLFLVSVLLPLLVSWTDRPSKKGST
jgi:membrane AbrB-like protein